MQKSNADILKQLITQERLMNHRSALRPIHSGAVALLQYRYRLESFGFMRNSQIAVPTLLVITFPVHTLLLKNLVTFHLSQLHYKRPRTLTMTLWFLTWMLLGGTQASRNQSHSCWLLIYEAQAKLEANLGNVLVDIIPLTLATYPLREDGLMRVTFWALWKSIKFMTTWRLRNG